MKRMLLAIILCSLLATPVTAQNAVARLPMELFRCQEFSANVAGTYSLLETDPTPFFPMFMSVYLRSVSGFSASPTINIGTNAPNYDNIVSGATLTGLDQQGEYFTKWIGTWVANGVVRGMSPQSSVSIKCKVTTPATATTYNVEVQLIGAYI